MATCLIALGSNLGDPRRTLSSATQLLSATHDVQVVAESRFYQTSPVGGPEGQDDFLNGAVRLETSLSPSQLLQVLQRIEYELGRVRHQRWAARTIDIDLLLYDQITLDTPDLVLPHPRMVSRRFVLAPAAEIADDMIHPTSSWTIGQLLANLTAPHPYVAIAGPIGVGKTLLARHLHERFGGRLIVEHLDSETLSRFYADPAALAWDTELRLLAARSAQLDQITVSLKEPSPTAAESVAFTWTDFWFDQSLAFAEVWLSDQESEAFEAIWHTEAAKLPKPNLLIALDAQTDLLLDRIQSRDRPYERQLSLDQLDPLRSALARRVEQCRQSPVLRLDATERDDLFAEAEAAITAMQDEPIVLQSPETP